MKATYEDHLGTDLTVVNAARVSFAKRSKNISDADRSLIRYLALGMSYKGYEALLERLTHPQDIATVKLILRQLSADPHWAPFAHPQISMHMKAPLAIRTQCFKHKIGFVESEVSRRYVDDPPEMFVPVLRQRAANKKQGSLNQPPEHLDKCDALVEMSYNAAMWAYRELIRRGVCPEQARLVLPTGTYTEWIWTGSLASWARFVRQRTSDHAQLEIAQLAQQCSEIIRPLFPVSWAALMGEDV